MSQHDDNRVDVAALLVAVCSGILEDALTNDGQDLNAGEYLSQAAVREVHEAVRLGMPTTPDDERTVFATGICTGLVAALRYIEALLQEDDEEPDYDG